MQDFSTTSFPVTHLQAILDTETRSHQFSGVVLIQQGDRTLFKATCGYANRVWKMPNQINTRFRLASVSKLFTAVAILQLVDAGQLTLDTRISDCLDLGPSAIPPEVTIAHLLTMTAGIADWFEESGDWEANWATLCRNHPIYLLRQNADYLPLFVHKLPVAPVGQHHQYNNAAYILLGLVIEARSGLSYFDYVRTHIFAKAGMINSDFLALDGIDENVAQGYIPITNKAGDVTTWQSNIYSTTPEAAADGGASSTVDDLIRFAQALRTEELLSPAQTTAILTPQVWDADDPETGEVWKYGYGNQFLFNQQGELLRWGHTGEEDGVSCRFYHYPHQNVDVVILANQSGCAGELAWAIHPLVLSLQY
ncbi:MAG: serine hydrolase domain-containing protein [Leptolyngbyaceae cyanobacterium]